MMSIIQVIYYEKTRRNVLIFFSFDETRIVTMYEVRIFKSISTISGNDFSLNSRVFVSHLTLKIDDLNACWSI